LEKKPHKWGLTDIVAKDIFAAYNLERGLTNIAIAGQN